jgi:hypothetical protein
VASSYPHSEWKRVVISDYDEAYPTLSLDSSEEFAWGKRETYYDIEVTRLGAEGEDVLGVRILKEGIVVVSPKSPTWWRIFRAYLEWKSEEEYLEDEEDLEEGKIG